MRQSLDFSGSGRDGRLNGVGLSYPKTGKPPQRVCYRPASGCLRMLRTVLFVLAAGVGSFAAELSVPMAAGAPGSILLVPVSFAPQSASATGIQFDLQYDPAVLSVTASVGEAARSSGKTLSMADPALGQKRFLLAGLNRTPLAGGILVQLFIGLSAGAAVGAYPLKIRNAAATDASAAAVAVEARDGGVAVEGAAGSGPRLLSSGVLNGASLLPGPVAAGEIVTLIGAGIGPASPQFPIEAATQTVLEGTSVLFDGTPAPLLYAAPSQINVIAPYAIAERASTRVEISQSDRTLAQIEATVAGASPALFTMDGSGTGPGAVFNENSTINSPSNPAEKGSILVLFATGAGQTEPAGSDGQIAADPLPKPLLPVSVRIGELDAEVVYAGAAPGLVAGVLQVNCVVPPDSASGYDVPITLSIGKFSSPVGPTVAVR